MAEYLITEFGAQLGELCTKAIQAAIDKAHENGGGRVCVPTGRFVTGSIQLRDNVELNLQIGAVLEFSDCAEDYPVISTRYEGSMGQVHSPCIYAKNAKNIALTGLGKVDGNGARWWNIVRTDKKSLIYSRPKLVCFDGCSEITVRDVTLTNSPSWTLSPLCCENITIDNVRIFNPANSPNTDGINPESCRNVRISNCHIDVGDDCIAIKSGTEDSESRIICENITITNCTMVHGHGGVVIGSEMSGGVRNVTVSNCVFQDTDRGIRLKSRRGRGGTVEDVRVSNVIMQNVICPFIVNLYYFCGDKGKDKYVWDKQPYPVDERTPCFKRIYFANITARDVHAAAGFVYGLPEMMVSDISFRDISISMAHKPIPGRPAMMSGIEDMTRSGFFVGFARDIRFCDVTIEGCEGKAIVTENVENITQTDVRV